MSDRTGFSRDAMKLVQENRAALKKVRNKYFNSRRRHKESQKSSKLPKSTNSQLGTIKQKMAAQNKKEKLMTWLIYTLILIVAGFLLIYSIS